MFFNNKDLRKSKNFASAPSLLSINNYSRFAEDNDLAMKFNKQV